MNDHHSSSDLLPLYALGVLSEPERAQIEAWLAQSAEAREALKEYQAMFTALAATVPLRKAPASLTSDFRDRLAAIATNAPAPQKSGKLPVRRLRWVVALAALLLIGITGIAAYALVVAQNNAQTLQAILLNNKATRVALVPQNGASGTLTFIRVDSNSNCVLEGQLPLLPSEEQYQLWLVNQNGERESSLVFDGVQEFHQWLMAVPDVNDHYVAVSITVEKRGGSTIPTSPPVFANQLPE
ncbi:MAG TPA: anti-sigma factor [Aggregatilineales bacterium]|nr:anti-sigma factor [Aggregatilineales bacterium]